MCGIIGVIGSNNPSHQVLEGLKRLEYRGYDSAGIAALENGQIDLRRRAGKLSALEELMTQKPLHDGDKAAIGHTRWATHGEPNETNAHPHLSKHCAVVHNGIIENYKELRTRLMKEGTSFKSDTDTETVPMLISQHMDAGKGKLDAVIETMKEVEGAFALGILFNDDKNQIIAARRGSPLVVGLAEGATYMGSDALALAPFTNKVIYLENDDVAVLTTKGAEVYTLDGKKANRPVVTVDVSDALAGKNGYRHFMLKEIHEQPTVTGETLTAYLDATRSKICFDNVSIDLSKATQVTIVACGTSYYAGCVAKYWLEEMAGIPVNVDIASEFRYRQPPLVKGGVCVFISQSGETADTLAALEYCKKAGQQILSIVNVPGSSIARESHAVLQTKAGPEIGVASTKAFTTQLMVLALLAIETGRQKGLLSGEKVAELIHALTEVPARMTAVLDMDSTLQRMAEQIMHARSALYLGRGSQYPIALEGALKLKEISYIHAEGYAAGEMKHGPIALIEEGVPVITIAPWNTLFEKTVSNMQEVAARKGSVYLITDKKGAAAAGTVNGGMIVLPDAHPFVQPILSTLPVQLLAYHVAVMKGTDVDQPRNLAKSVTVE
ncbi:MAG: glutamine--fructose-6-phosphate transaminase (isomerizing) [Proteobacteria bacterium]|nr:glutamine--fructose-6-phosphate transaminase (isomerizing) [Pseudomonadota bacterium]